MRNQKLTPRERLPIAATRFIRQTYSNPGKARLHNKWGWHGRLLATPLVVNMERLPGHECTLDNRWSNPGVYSCCWGMTHTVTIEYGQTGAQSKMGARFDHKTDTWEFQVWMD